MCSQRLHPATTQHPQNRVLQLTHPCSGCPLLCSLLASCRFVGEVTRVDATLLRSLVNSGYIPVVATVATDENGQALNVNADTAAGEVSLLYVMLCLACWEVVAIWQGSRGAVVVRAAQSVKACSGCKGGDGREWAGAQCQCRHSCRRGA
jgi:hypothetical protein